MINKGHIEPVLNFWAGKLWFKMVNTCRFEIQVKRVNKEAVKALPKGLYGRQIAEKQHSWPPRLLGITNSFELKRVCARTYVNKNEEQL